MNFEGVPRRRANLENWGASNSHIGPCSKGHDAEIER